MPDLRRQIVEVPFNSKKLAVSTLSVKRSNKWVVGLHGIQSNKELFTDLFAQQFLADYSLLAIDFVGFGESDKPENFSYDIEDQADVITYILNYFKIERLHLIGHSMGGMVGTLLLPKLGGKLISFINLEGNLVLADCGESKDVIAFNREEFETAEFDRMKAKVKQSPEKSAALRSEWLNMIPARVFYESSLSIVEWSKSERLQVLFNRPGVKRIFMYGSKNARKTEAVSGSAEIVEIPEAGHFMLIDQPEECSRAISKFM